MIHQTLYAHLADAVVLAHVLLVAFVILGLAAVPLGNQRQWAWVNALLFRALHLTAIGVVIAESWLGITCPLTTLEAWLRGKAGQGTYSDSFVGHWLQTILYFNAAWWVFALAYSFFGLLVVASWIVYPPRAFKRRAS